mmetsp:Transcript_50670/g.163885  ORF Transcript_50670/g.163885 Transcript_50670/m.163885 type:complete len:364 (-) Transcript_50670:761-1852(-)
MRGTCHVQLCTEAHHILCVAATLIANVKLGLVERSKGTVGIRGDLREHAVRKRRVPHHTTSESPRKGSLFKRNRLILLIRFLSYLGCMRLPPTIKVGLNILVVMKGDLRSVRARRPMATGVREEVDAIHHSDAQLLIQAHLHEEVLAPAGPIKVLQAILGVSVVHPERVSSHDLHGPEELQRVLAGVPEAPVAIADQQGRSVDVPGNVPRVHLNLESMREEDSVWVYLDRPIVVPPPPILQDHVPSFDEDCRVQPRRRCGAGLREISHGHGRLVGRQNDLLGGDGPDLNDPAVAVDNVVITIEDGGVVLPLTLQERRLVAVRTDDLPAKQTWQPRGCGRTGRRDRGRSRCCLRSCRGGPRCGR